MARRARLMWVFAVGMDNPRTWEISSLVNPSR
jgi:hypothetical protein